MDSNKVDLTGKYTVIWRNYIGESYQFIDVKSDFQDSFIGLNFMNDLMYDICKRPFVNEPEKVHDIEEGKM